MWIGGLTALEDEIVSLVVFDKSLRTQCLSLRENISHRAEKDNLCVQFLPGPMVTSLSRKRIDVDKAVPVSLMMLMSGNMGEFGSCRNNGLLGRVWKIIYW